MITYLTPADVARSLGVTPATIRNMADRGELRVTAKTQSGIRLFTEKTVERVRRAREHADG